MLGFEEGAQEVVDPYIKVHILGDPKDEKIMKTSTVSIHHHFICFLCLTSVFP